MDGAEYQEMGNVSRLGQVKESQRIWIYGAMYQEGVWMTILGNPTIRDFDFPHARKSGGAADMRIKARSLFSRSRECVEQLSGN